MHLRPAIRILTMKLACRTGSARAVLSFRLTPACVRPTSGPTRIMQFSRTSGSASANTNVSAGADTSTRTSPSTGTSTSTGTGASTNANTSTSASTGAGTRTHGKANGRYIVHDVFVHLRHDKALQSSNAMDDMRHRT
jgi:hypothetical protein